MRSAAETFGDEIPTAQFEHWLQDLQTGFELPKRRGGNINVRRIDACTLFLAFPNQTTKKLLQSTFSAPRTYEAKEKASKADKGDDRGSSSKVTIQSNFPGARGTVFLWVLPRCPSGVETAGS